MRENALPILEAAGVDLVLAGHSHIYERSYLIYGAYETPTKAHGHIKDATQGDPQIAPYKKPLKDAPGAVYITAGHGGASMRQDRKPHPVMAITENEQGSLLIDVHGTTLIAQNLRHDGKISDTFSIVKGRDAVMTSPFGGETLPPGSSQVARWAGPKDEAYIIEVSDGVDWQPVGESKVGRLSWTVPQGPPKARLRIRSKAGDITAMSREFSIGVPLVETVEPARPTMASTPPVAPPSAAGCSVTGGDSSWALIPFLFGLLRRRRRLRHAPQIK